MSNSIWASGIIALILGILGLFYFLTDEAIESKCAKYNIYDNYQNNYSFGKHKEQKYYATLNNCDLIVSKTESYLYYEKYFIGKYVDLVEDTPKSDIESFSDSINLILNLIEDPIPKSNNTQINYFRNELISNIEKGTEIPNDVIKTEKIITAYIELYDVSESSNEDEILEQIEIDKIKDLTGEFIYVTLKQTGVLSDLEKSDFFKNKLGIGLNYFKWLFTGINFLFGYDIEKNMYGNIFEEFLFEVPIDYFYNEMKRYN
jgi:hypothetical protein